LDLLNTIMPTYTFIDTNTGEQFDKFLKIAEREQYLNDNPHIQSVITAPAITGDHITIKKDSGFKEVLQKINERNPHNSLKNTSSQL
jgi:predicted nucleic acid-binding Zn ribbon protein